MEYKIIEHAVSNDVVQGERHFFRVAVWFGKEKGEPDAHADFLLHLGPSDPFIENGQMILPDPMERVYAIIEQRLLALNPGDDDNFADHEREHHRFRAPRTALHRKIAKHVGLTRKAEVNA